jgi:hypothetical protein
MARPASTQAARNSGKVRAAARASVAGIASSVPLVITGRGPMRSRSRPTGTPARADTTSPVEKPAVTAGIDQTQPACCIGSRTARAEKTYKPPERLLDEIVVVTTAEAGWATTDAVQAEGRLVRVGGVEVHGVEAELKRF